MSLENRFFSRVPFEACYSNIKRRTLQLVEDRPFYCQRVFAGSWKGPLIRASPQRN